MLGALLGAGTKILGGILGGRSQRKAQEREYQRQKEFAQHGISWRAADAERAGISKLYALGANTTSYSPQSVGGTDYGLSAAGQDISRAVSATQSGNQRIGKIAHAIQTEQLEGLKLDNDLRRTRIASEVRRLNQPGNPPAYPNFDTKPHIPGQGDSRVDYKKSIAPAGRHPEASYGVAPEVDWYRTKSGYTPQIPQQLAESFEQNWLGAAAWQLRNSLAPYLGLDGSTPPAVRGHYYNFHPIWGYQKKRRPRNYPKNWIKKGYPRR